MNKFIMVFFTMLAFTASVFAKSEVSELLFKGEPLVLEEIVQRARIGTGERFSGPLISRWYRDNPNAQVTDASPIIKDNKLYGWNIHWVKKSSPTYVSVEYMQTASPFLLPVGMSVESVMKEMWKGVSKQLSFYKSWPVAVNMVQKEEGTVIHGLWYMSDTRSGLRFGKNGSATFVIPNGDVNGALKNSEIAMEAKVPLSPALQAFAVSPPSRNLPNYGEVIVMAPFKQSWTKWISIQPHLSKGKIVEMRIKYVVEGTPAHASGLKSESILKSIQGVNPVGLTETEFDAKLSAAQIIDDLVIVAIEKKGQDPRTFTIPIRKAHEGLVSSVDR